MKLVDQSFGQASSLLGSAHATPNVCGSTSPIASAVVNSMCQTHCQPSRRSIWARRGALSRQHPSLLCWSTRKAGLRTTTRQALFGHHRPDQYLARLQTHSSACLRVHRIGSYVCLFPQKIYMSWFTVPQLFASPKLETQHTTGSATLRHYVYGECTL